jgi:glucose-1-phosphate thymidylyltransferase
MKGIILAGGAGTRLHPVTLSISKQLLPVYDKPMIYYPLSTLMLAGIREILIISNTEYINSYEELLQNGEKWGIEISYLTQTYPRGLPDAFILGEEFIDNKPVSLILGDNIIYGSGLIEKLRAFSKIETGASIFAYQVRDPERFGVIEFNEKREPIGIVEKPKNSRSNYAIPGIYFFDKQVSEYSKMLTPSKRNETEIVDLLKIYLEKKMLNVEVLGRGIAWLDAGTPDALLQASNFIQAVQERQGFKISCPEEIAWRMKFIDDDQFRKIAASYKNQEYRAYLESIFDE